MNSLTNSHIIKTLGVDNVIFCHSKRMNLAFGSKMITLSGLGGKFIYNIHINLTPYRPRLNSKIEAFVCIEPQLRDC